MEQFKTKYGMLQGVLRYDTYMDGQINECGLNEKNIIETKYGDFIPQYSTPDAMFNRIKKIRSSISFYENGEAKSIALEEQTVVKTPIGEYPAELVTFYDDGSLNRVFPLNGQINGFWSEEDEGNLAETFKFDFPFGKFSAKIISLRFYPSGNLKSLTLWPGEVITVETPAGDIDIRVGFSLYEDGTIKSVEPAMPLFVMTEIGVFQTYDYDALGIHADVNSLKFDKEGYIVGLKSSDNGVIVTDEKGNQILVEPREVVSYIDDSETVIVPIEISFESSEVVINNGLFQKFDMATHKFLVTQTTVGQSSCGSSCGTGGCSSCSGCH